MKHISLKITVGLLLICLLSCTSSQKDSEDMVMEDSSAAVADSPSNQKQNDSFADDNPAQSSDEKSAQNTNDKSNQDQVASVNDKANEKKVDDLSLDDQPEQSQPQQSQPEQQAIVAQPTPEPTPQAAPEPVPVVVQEPAPTPIPQPVIAPEPAVAQVAHITGLKFKANDSGGTVVIEADAAVTFTTRSNPDLKQMVIEVQNSVLPKKFKRGLNTKDINGVFGSVDAYQNVGSKISRFVIQLRDNAPEPTVQQEGNTLLIVGANPAPAIAANATATNEVAASVDDSGSDETKVLSANSLDEFLVNNTKFYGKKISIETNNIETRDALRFIMEEANVNMVVSEDVKGSISLKLRQVPWDQALVTILKAKKLGYSRQGSVLRIAPIAEFKGEEEDAVKIALAKKNLEPLKVRMFSVSYAKVDELDKKLKDFLSERGKVISDTRTNALVVTDTDEGLIRAAKLIKSLDVQPPQVLIEGKIVEAKESFVRSVGVNWGSTGADVRIGSSKQGPVNMHPAFQVNPLSSTAGTLAFNLNIGTLDVLGDLTSALSLSERESKVKVISSPRIVTMSNEKADISQTTEVAIPQVTPIGNTPQTTFTFKPLSLKLDVTPQITNDASVIMKVGVKREFRDASANPNDQNFAVNIREANTRVIVKNGQTAVIGGIYQSDATESESGVPYLREIPVLGALFRGKGTTKDKAELLIFLTPRILGAFDSAATPAGSDL